MSLAGGDLTTPQRVAAWMAAAPPLPSAIISQLIGSMTSLIYSKLNRARTFSQLFTRTFDGVGNMQLLLPDYPVTSILAVQQGNALIPPANVAVSPIPSSWYGYRFIPWNNNLPGTNAMLEYAGGYFYSAPQNVKVTYQAGYLVSNEPAVIPATPFHITVLQQEGIWCRDNGVVYVSTGLPLTPVAAITAAGQYIPPSDATPGLYTFGTADTGQAILISYSFIPAALEEACIQMVAERYSYRGRIGEVMKSLGGQETIRYQRGAMGMPWNRTSSLPPEVMDLIWDYVSVVPPEIGAPV
jgi:hypothetical protein